jgi:hypothetical protein
MHLGSYIRAEQIDPELIRSVKRTRTALTVSFIAHGVALALVAYLMAQ